MNRLLERAERPLPPEERKREWRGIEERNRARLREKRRERHKKKDKPLIFSSLCTVSGTSDVSGLSVWLLQSAVPRGTFHHPCVPFATPAADSICMRRRRKNNVLSTVLFLSLPLFSFLSLTQSVFLGRTSATVSATTTDPICMKRRPLSLSCAHFFSSLFF